MSERRVWLLLRGLVREQRHWGNFPVVLQSHFPDDRIILYDSAGNGQRNIEKSATTIQAMVDDLRTFLIHRTVSRPVYIIALSLGAMVAVEWMNKYPKECAAAVLISTSLRGLNPFYQRLLPSAYPVIIKSLLLPGRVRKKESMNLRLVSNTVTNDAIKSKTVIDHWVDYAEQCPVAGTNGLRQLLAAIRFRIPEKRPEPRMLVLNSSADRLVSPQCSLNLARRWQLPIKTHGTAGHDIPLDDGEWVCANIARWLTNEHQP